MTSPTLAEKVTAVLITLNEETNIRECIKSILQNGIQKVILVDASSTDRTVELARSMGAECHIVPKKGLAFQRQFGVDLVKTPYVCLVDADNRLDPRCILQLLDYIESSDFVGVAAQKLNAVGTDYWSKGWDWTNRTSLYLPGEKIVIGTPALYRTEVLKAIRYDPSITVSDDTDLCYRLSKLGKKVAAGPGVCREHMRSTFRGFAKKLIWYGRGDAEFFLKHPERRWAISTHPIKNYFLKGQLRALLSGRPDLMPYFAIYGVLRSFGFFKALIEFKVLGTKNIYKT